MASRSVADRAGPADRAGRRDLAIAATALPCLAVACAVPPSTIEDGPVVCPFRLATGLPCPGCGMARSWVAFGHGDLDAAVAHHPLGPALFVLEAAAVAAVAARALRRAAPVDIASLAGRRPALAVAGAWCAWWAVALVT